ncbi:MAG: Asp-tRNA(Asn)/Glu-tRNA(Gln) amidotransferase subunit GatC [Nanoarchaeota archaeon]
MEVDNKLINHVANLAKLELTDEEIKKFTVEIKEILNNFEIINEVDTKNVKPSFHPIKLEDELREDIIKNSFTQEQALKNSKKSHIKDGYFKGPKAI